MLLNGLWLFWLYWFIIYAHATKTRFYFIDFQRFKMAENIKYIPTLKINPAYISEVDEYIQPIQRSEKQIDNEKNLANNDTGGEISEKSNRNIKKGVEWLIYLAKKKAEKMNNKSIYFKANFVTLTLCCKQIHSDEEIKRELLNHFLTVAKQRWGVHNYVWRAEAQENGNIHFHIITDRFIPALELRQTWNGIQNKLGYVDRFEKKHKKINSNPNSTDIHALKHVHRLADYIGSYATKNKYIVLNDRNKKLKNKDLWTLRSNTKIKFTIPREKNYIYATKEEFWSICKTGHHLKLVGRLITGKLWDMNTALEKIKSFEIIVSDKITEEWAFLREKFKNYYHNKKYVGLLYVRFDEWKKYKNLEIYKKFKEYTELIDKAVLGNDFEHLKKCWVY